MPATLLPPPRSEPIVLRPYQAGAIDAVYQHLRDRDDNPCVVLPTASGKTIVMATICRDAVEKWNGRVLILAHVKELLQQTADTLRCVAPDLEIGVYSAGLKSRDTRDPIIVAGIQSVYKRACELDAFDLAIVDECFPAGTRIDGRPIESIRPGDQVRSFNHSTGRIEAKTVLAVRKRQMPSRMARITRQDGRTITCTPNHPFFTGSEYVPAQSLIRGRVHCAGHFIEQLFHVAMHRLTQLFCRNLDILVHGLVSVQKPVEKFSPYAGFIRPAYIMI